MAIIDPAHETVLEDQQKFWEDTLKNTRIIFFELDKAIFILTHDDKKSYSMDTGQTTINVTRQDLPQLIDRRAKLKEQIEELEQKVQSQIQNDPNSRFIQVIPVW